MPKELSKALKSCVTVPEEIKKLEKAAQRKIDKWRRIEAMIILGHINSPHALDIFKKAVQDRDDDIVYFSAISLGHIKSPGSANMLLDLIKNRTISGYKIASILEGFPPSIVEELARRTEDKDPVMRLWAVKILSRFRPSQYAGKIAVLVNDESADVRAAACEFLGELGDRSAKDAVGRCLKDDAWIVRVNAVKAFEKILKKECVPEIMPLIKDNNQVVRDTVKRIAEDYIEEDIGYIDGFLHESGQKVRKDCVEILEESGYDKKILEDVISENAKIKARAIGLLNGMIKAGAHLGLESDLRAYPKDKQEKILRVIADIDRGAAEHIDKKIKGQIEEI